MNEAVTSEPIPEAGSSHAVTPAVLQDNGDVETTSTGGLSGWAARLRAVPVDHVADSSATTGAEPLELPTEVREAARLAPDHWLGLVDPAWRGEGEPPSWAVLGQWRSNGDGEIVEWAENPDYRPSPAMLGWEEPKDPVDAAVQLAATGYGPAENVTRLLAAAEVAVLVDTSGSPVCATAPDGTAVVPTFTSESHLASAGALKFEVHPVTMLIGQVPRGHQLYLNPAGPVAFVVDREALLAAVEETPSERYRRP
ncbi:type VII secretion system-associated protein [Streptomyces sp. NPDC026673]|uniref:type VII secretion system-associated protein n=1 Tax=Streptomyces sp. NPDC026673 TaxID=3155724 RepID=UPI0033F2370D